MAPFSQSAFAELDTHTKAQKVALVTAFALLAFRFIHFLYRGLTSPLKHVPGPLSTRFSYWPLKLAIVQGKRVYYVDQLHAKYGPCVRISPEEVAISDLASTKEIHRIGGGFLKARWYSKFTQQKQPEEEEKGVFSMENPKVHAARRKLLAHGFSKAALREWDDVVREKVDMAVRGIEKQFRETGKGDVLAWFTYMANDVISTLSFGDSFKSLETGAKTQFILDLETVMKLSGVMMELPLLSPVLSRIQPRGRLLAAGEAAIAEHSRREQQGLAYRNTIFTKMVTAGEEKTLSLPMIQREASNMIVAGSDTTAVSLTYLVYAVLACPDLSVRQRLNEELATLQPGFTAGEAAELPFLGRVIQETLRLYGAAPGGLPRTVPKDGRVLGGHFIPGGFTASTQAYTLHRDPSIFREPLQWNPDRWLQPSQEMKDAYMPYGGGTRVCLGLHLAQMELALGAATFFRSFPNAKLHPDTTPASMEFENYFLIAPRSHQCLVLL